ncbi:TetR/AcrR family transcriptional regulator [Paenibacillus brasilensis]|uniref:AcrR family transcriptional regulator n=1 Tax=Paenibacillus brasilensis TaxID=128574 RepID=A0ABU0L5M3_9BACL|nr:TetR/AcrR family transcriptional regulator [Paenibacillus brasilensis]MDQ0496561.1 AcrR family transcriptional regulator [Paenibacillus brasilensis]
MDSNQNNVSGARGRPRSNEVHRNILDTTLYLLAEVGVEKLSIEMVAQRAGVGKASIYRRWANKEALIVDALEQIKPEFNMPSQGNLNGDLYELASHFVQRMNTPLGKQMLSLLISTLAGSSQISEAFWENHSLPKTKEISSIIDRYRQNERLSEDANVDLAADLMIGFIMYQLLFKPPTEDLDSSLKQGIEMIVKGIRKPD